VDLDAELLRHGERHHVIEEVTRQEAVLLVCSDLTRKKAEQLCAVCRHRCQQAVPLPRINYEIKLVLPLA
jgi:hypothetical protein